MRIAQCLLLDQKMISVAFVNAILLASFGLVSADSQCTLSPEQALAAAKQLQASLQKDGSYKVDVGYSKWFMTFNGMGPEVGLCFSFAFPPPPLPAHLAYSRRKPPPLAEPQWGLHGIFFPLITHGCGHWGQGR